jgi:hypothetical protein
MLWAILLLLVAACAVGYLVADVAIHEAIEEEVERRIRARTLCSQAKER